MAQPGRSSEDEIHKLGLKGGEKISRARQKQVNPTEEARWDSDKLATNQLLFDFCCSPFWQIGGAVDTGLLGDY